MKKNILFSLFCFLVLTSNAQTGASTLNENFDVSCVSPSGFPGGWYRYNPLASTVTFGEWTCNATNGRQNSLGVPTPGIQCSDTFASAYYLDTSYLLTPMLNLSSYTAGHAFLQFDTKTTRVYLGGDISVIGRSDTSRTDTVHFYFTPTPVFSNGDSSGWVTHVVDLSSLITYGPFYIAFRYTSTSSTGSVWFLDNVKLTTVNITLSEPEIADGKVALGVISAAEDAITFSYLPPSAGNYDVLLYDMMGHMAYHGSLAANGQRADYTISGINLAPGMYVLKMGNAHASGFEKVMVR